MARGETDPHTVTLSLTNDEALVLSDWLARSAAEGRPAPFEDQAEQRVLWNLDCLLEATLTEPVAPDYDRLLAEARSRVRDEDEGPPPTSDGRAGDDVPLGHERSQPGPTPRDSAG